MIAHETIRELAQSWLICMIIADIINTTQHHTSAFLTLHQYSCSGCFSVIFGLLIVVCWCMNQSAKDMCRPFNIIFTANESTLPLCHNSVKPQKQTNKSKKKQKWPTVKQYSRNTKDCLDCLHWLLFKAEKQTPTQVSCVSQNSCESI